MFFRRKIGIDLGTANTLVFLPEKGVVVNEPTVVAMLKEENRVVAVGREAKEMLGRTPHDIKALRPLKDGVIADYRITEVMLRYFIGKARGGFLFRKPEVVISVPAGISSTEKRAVIAAAEEAGAGNVYIVKEPILAALGAKISINSSTGSMIVNIGGGTTEVAIISLGGIVNWASVRVAGNMMDQAIQEHVKKKYGLVIGERMAEFAKIKIGSALPSDFLQSTAQKKKNGSVKEEVVWTEDESGSVEVKGREITSGLPKTIMLSPDDIVEAISKELFEIIETIKKVIGETPPELTADIINRGITLSGGGALLRNLDELISKMIGVPVYVSEEPLFCVAKGTGVIIDNLELYKRAVITKKPI